MNNNTLERVKVDLPQSTRTGIGLAGTAITGAAGLAQAKEDRDVDKE